jgi:ankyrin repeat protein
MYFPSLVVSKIIKKCPNGNVRLVCRDWKYARCLEEMLEDKFEGDADKIFRRVLKSGDLDLSTKRLSVLETSSVFPMEYLKIASQCGDTRICKLLLDHKWEYTIRRSYINDEGEFRLTSEPYVMKNDVRLAMKDAIDYDRINVIKFYLDNYVEKSLDYLQREIEYAIRKGKLDIFRLLIGHTQMSLGYTNFMLTVAAEMGHLEMCNDLYVKGAQPNSVEGRALMRAARNGHYPVCVFLTTVKENPARPCRNQSDALRVAATKGFLDICALLIDRNLFGNYAAKPRMQKQAAITGAIAKGHTNIVSLLIKEKGVDLNALLKFAAKCGKHDICELLIKNGADPNETLSYTDEVLEVLMKGRRERF